jgi:iron complex outermembrane receptor protein
MKAKLFGTTALLMGALAVGLPVGSAFAQDGAEEGEIVVTGTRRASRSAADTPAPVDVISAQELLDQADTDLQNILRTSVPSYNVNTQPISDAATLVRPANLRGLPPDSTLVLVNGKRRHRAAVISFLGGGISDGSQGPDLSVIPAIALGQVEVLRDGAASQYGSDAIAGVMNFILRDDPEGAQLEAEWGQTYEGDGTQYSIAGNLGVAIGDRGFINISAEYGETDATSRSVQRDDAAALIAAGNTDVADPAQIWGQPNVDDDLTMFFNSAFELTPTAELYAFGNFAERRTEGGFFFRNPNNRGGVFGGPRWNTATGNIANLNDNGTPNNTADDFFEDSVTLAVVANPGYSILVGDLSVANTGDCPAYLPLSTPTDPNSLPDAVALAALQADANCFSFYEMFPGGFTPRFGGELEDKSIAFGVRGELPWGLTYDLSYYYGRNDIDFFINNTINASLGPNTPTSFNPGGYSQEDENYNFDFGYAIPIGGFASDLNIAFGGEHRTETFEIRAGDPASYALGPLAAPSIAYPGGQGFSSSSNGFGGFTPASAGTSSQSNWAVYIDAEADVTDSLVLQAAVRHENFDVYGETTNYKLGGLYRFTPYFTGRATWSTGFRAPTPGQANVTNITTAFNGATLVDQGTLPLSSAAGQFMADRLELSTGFRPTLTPEESENFTIGAAFRFGGIDVTVDYFNIEVTDRIAISDQQDFLAELLEFAAEAPVVVIPPGSTTSQVLNLLDGAGRLNAADFAGSEDLTSFAFFTNSFDTQTRGVDVVASTRFDLMGGESSLALAMNWTDTEVTNTGQDTAAPLTIGRRRQIEENLPNFRGNLTFTHEQGVLRGLARVNYYGEYFECHLDAINNTPGSGCDLPIDGDAMVTLDLEGGIAITDNFEISVGAQNVTDQYPNDNPWGAAVAGAAYPPNAPAGFNGGFYYVRTRATF